MLRQSNIIVIDDEEAMRDSCLQVLSKEGFSVETAKDGNEGLVKIKKELFDLVILDLKMPGPKGLDILKQIKEDDPETIVIVITGFASVESAVKAMKLGAYDFLPKPFTPDELRIIVNRALEKLGLMLENIYLRNEVQKIHQLDTIIGQSQAMKKIIDLVSKIGPSDSTVLITGESGTGKDVIAKALYNNSARNSKPFITVDCGSLVESLFESELFGHVKGSFTGAISTKFGRFETANGGTIFFDEIGNIGTNIQGKLLRAIEEREIFKVGSSEPLKIDVRIIAATNQNLHQAVSEGSFREDLFYRLSVFPIHLPPLRDRKEDILLFAEYFLKKHCQKKGGNIEGFTEQAQKILQQHNWPGNVRELENTIERAAILCDSSIIDIQHLFYFDLPLTGEKKVSSNTVVSLEDSEKELIVNALEMFNNNKSKTAKALGIDRKTLQNKINKFGLL